MVQIYQSFRSCKTHVASDSPSLHDAATLSLSVQIDVFLEIQYQHPAPGPPHPDWVSAMFRIHPSSRSSKTKVSSDSLHLHGAATQSLSFQIEVFIEIQYQHPALGAFHQKWVSAIVRSHQSSGSSKTIVASDSLHLDDDATLSLLAQIDVFIEIQFQHPPTGAPHPD